MMLRTRKEEPTAKNEAPKEISEPRVEEYCTLVQSLERNWSDIKKSQLRKRVSRTYPMALCKLLYRYARRFEIAMFMDTPPPFFYYPQ
jgi:hypothetical protein